MKSVQVHGKQAIRFRERFQMLGLGATLLGALDRLNRLEVHGFIGVCIDKSYSEYLKPPLGRSGAAGPEVSHTRSLLSGLADVARVNGDCRALLPHMFGELRVELQPVEDLPEVLAEPALTGVRNSGH